MGLFTVLTGSGRPSSQQPVVYSPVVGGLLSQSLCFAQIYTNHMGRTIEGLVDNYKGTLSTLTVWNGPSLDTHAASVLPVISYGSNPQTQDLNLGAFSVFARVYTGANWGAAGGLCRRNSVNAGWEVCCNTNGTALSFVRSSTNQLASTTTALSSGTWHTVLIVYDGTLSSSSVKIYYDGKPQTVTVSVGAGTQGTDASQIFSVGDQNYNTGAPFTATGPFSGTIDCLYVWRRQLSNEEAIALACDPYAPVYERTGLRFATSVAAPPPSGFPAFFFAA
jgi:hypothetical protein